MKTSNETDDWIIRTRVFVVKLCDSSDDEKEKIIDFFQQCDKTLMDAERLKKCFQSCAEFC